MREADASRTPSVSWVDLGFSPATFEKNLAALAGRRPEIGRLIEDGGIHGGLSVVEDLERCPRVVKRHRRRIHLVEESEADLDAAAAEIWGHPQSRSTLLVGLGTGERAARLLARLSPDHVLAVHEPDPSLLVLALSRHDWSEAIASGRLQILSGSDLFDRRIPEFTSALLHPRLEGSLQREWRRVQEAIQGDEAPGRARAAVLAGELLQEELTTSLEEEGAATWVFDASVLSRAAIVQELVRFDATTIHSINFRPELAEIAGRIGMAYGPWEIDPTASPIPSVVPGTSSPCSTHVFTWRKSRVAAFVAKGWTRSSWLPLAAHPLYRRPPERIDPTLAGKVVFVGSSLRRSAETHWSRLESGFATPQQRRSTDFEGFRRAIEDIEAELRSDPSRRDAEARILAAMAAHGMPECISGADGEAEVLMLAGERLASAKRVALAARLSRQGLVVFGDEGWKDAAPGLDWRGPLGHGADMNRVLGSAAAVLDIGRAYQSDIVTLRCFETTACGGLLLAEGGSGIEELFRRDEEVLVWDDLESLERIFDQIVATPRDGAQRREAGRRRCLSDHTVGQRLAAMRAVLSEIQVLA